jgi:tellurite resistance protein
MGIGLLIDFLLEATFGIAFDSVSQSFVSYRDLAALKAMSMTQKEAFLQGILLVMMADGGLSEEERAHLEARLEKLPDAREVEALVSRIQQQIGAALLEGRGEALLDALLAALPEQAQRQALVNVAWEVHRIDDHHVEEKMDILHRLCDATGVFPAGID